eukprot:1161301-Pelagomonas_calceolata.AAC.6
MLNKLNRQLVCKHRLHPNTVQLRQLQLVPEAASVTQYLPSTKSEAVQLTLEMKRCQASGRAISCIPSTFPSSNKACTL